MKIGIISPYPHVFTLALAQFFKMAGSVNIKSNGSYSKILFDDSDENQERDGIYFNALESDFDYELIVNQNLPCDVTLVVTRPIYRDLLQLKEILDDFDLYGEDDKKKLIVITEQMHQGLKFTHKLILSSLQLPLQTEHYELATEEKDIIADCTFGVGTGFHKDKLSKEYQNLLLIIFNRLHGTNYTKVKQIQKAYQKKVAELEREVE